MHKHSQAVEEKYYSDVKNSCHNAEIKCEFTTRRNAFSERKLMQLLCRVSQVRYQR